jgi:hypothetical protein
MVQICKRTVQDGGITTEVDPEGGPAGEKAEIIDEFQLALRDVGSKAI